MAKIRFATAPLLVALALPVFAGPNLVVNGDFESPNVSAATCFQGYATIGNWVAWGVPGAQGSCYQDSGYVEGSWTAPAARSGSQMMELNRFGFAGSLIGQGVQLVAGTAYQLSFSMAGMTGNATVPSVLVTLDQGIGSQTFSSVAGATWVDKAWNFTAQNTAVTVFTFRSTSGLVNLDSVVLQAIPEASTVSMMAAGLAMVVGVAMRRRRESDPSA